MPRDIFDRVNLDVLDRVELPIEEKVIYSPEMQKAIDDAIEEKIKEIPLDKMISRIVDLEVQKQKERMERDLIKNKESQESLKQFVLDSVKRAKDELTEKIEKVDEQMDGIDEDAQKMLERMRGKYDQMINTFNNPEIPPMYAFGGYPPPGGAIPITFGGLDSWRFIVIGDNLSVQRFESGAWVEKAQFNP